MTDESSTATKSYQRRAYFTNLRFQLKYTGLLIGVVLSVIAALSSVIWEISETSVGHAEFAAEQAVTALKESRTASQMVQTSALTDAAESPELLAMLKEDTEKLDRQHEQALAGVQARIQSVKQNQQRLIKTLIVTSIALLGILFVTGIYITHKIVGPAFRMKRLLRQVGTGRLVVKDRLRRGDELGDLFDTFLQMTYSLKALQLERLATLDVAIQRARSSGASAEVLQALERLRNQLTSGLGQSVDPPAQTAQDLARASSASVSS